MLLFTHFALWLMQPDVSTMVSGGGGEGAAAPPGGMGGMGTILMMLAMFAGLYFFVLRPENKRRDEHQKMIEALQKGAIVRTTGGIRGEITGFEDNYVVLKIAEKTRIRVLRGHIADLEPSASEAAPSESQKDEKNDNA